MLTKTDAKDRLLTLLKTKSVVRGDFVLSSGGKSNYYVDCKLTTLDPEGATLVGEVMHTMIGEEIRKRSLVVNGIGGLTMGADPIALAVCMRSYLENPDSPLKCFIVRKTPKAHGQTKLIEGNFKKDDTVVVIDDVVTKGDSTLKAIEAVEKEGGHVAFVAVLVDRQEGGRVKIEDRGFDVIAAFTRDELLQQPSPSYNREDCVVA